MSASGDLQALVLAGSRRAEVDAVALEAGVACKAFAPVAGTPMIERVLEVLLACRRVARIDVAVADQTPIAAQAPRLSEWLERGVLHRQDPAASPARTVAASLDRLPEGGELLIATADHALLTMTILDQFLMTCDQPGIDAQAGLLPLDILEARYPTMRRTGFKLRDGRYSGCNLFLFRNTAGGRSLVSFWQRLESLRKSPVRIAHAVGPIALIAYGLRLLSLSQAVDLIGRRAHARLAPALLDIPEAAIDVDTPADLAFVSGVLARQLPDRADRSGSGP